MPRLLVLLALGASACSATTPPVAGTTTASASDPARSSAPAAASAGASAGPGAESSTSGNPAPGTAGGAAAVARTRPPATGTYTYTQDGGITFGALEVPFDPTGTLVVSPPKNGVQKQVREYSDDFTLTERLRFGGDRVTLLATATRFGGREYACSMEEPMTLVALPLETGDSWRSSSRCGRMKVTIRVSVEGTEVVTIGGSAVDTVVLHVLIDVVEDDAEQHSDVTSWIAPEHSLAVRLDDYTTGKSGGVSFSIERVDELRSLTPA